MTEIDQEGGQPVRRGIKQGVPLSGIPELPEGMVRKLRGLSVTTMEEFYSYLGASRESLLAYLSAPDELVEQIPDIAKRYLGEEKVAEMDAFVPREHPTGAISPYSSEEEQYLIQRRIREQAGNK